MSMSQEEIEALMNGLDIVDDDESSNKEETPIIPEETSVVNTDEIEELISQNEEINIPESNETKEPEKIQNEALENNQETFSSDAVDNNDIDALLKDLETAETSDPEIDNKAESIFDIDLEPIANNDITTESFDDVSADEEGIVESTNKLIEDQIKEDSNNKEEIGKHWADSRIDEGIFPLPADNNTKVVSQLSQVANDSEEKVSQIFDVLSLTLDNNTEIRNTIESSESYIKSELELLNSLSAKFPNIEVFNTQKKLAIEMSEKLNSISDILDSEDMKIFEAMELMQFNDINRQKIERVMSVIRRLSTYLNNLFEDDGTSQEISVAKHIHGDSNNDLIGADLDKLINEFGK